MNVTSIGDTNSLDADSHTRPVLREYFAAPNDDEEALSCPLAGVDLARGQITHRTHLVFSAAVL
ncbi:hypothetical protein O9992_26070 [Vibrio lentus]|nr:hypothetical protein [Vibrio lentus]